MEEPRGEAPCGSLVGKPRGEAPWGSPTRITRLKRASSAIGCVLVMFGKQVLTTYIFQNRVANQVTKKVSETNRLSPAFLLHDDFQMSVHPRWRDHQPHPVIINVFP